MRPAAALLAAAAFAITACNGAEPAAENQPAANAGAPAAQQAPALSLTRLDCGTITIKKFNDFFSDRPGLYPNTSRDVTDSCYLIRHGDQQMIWDTGLPADLKGRTEDGEQTAATLSRTLAEQLAELGVKPADIDVVAVSHMHFDHIGQAAEFPQARLIVGRGDFEQTAGEDDPFGPWRGERKPVTLATGDVDIFGDGSVVALHLPGHTPNHLALLVKLASGPVLLSGDLYHSRDAREKRGVPPFNTDRAQTLASMDRFEQIAKQLGAKVIIQHEPRDVALLPGFPQAAQ